MFNFMKKGKIEYLIVGLGNPGSTYEKTRHNAGFSALDKLAENEGFEFKKIKFHALVADEMIAQHRCLLMKPQTMMNNSGEAVYEAATYYNIPDENIIVVYDDVSLDGEDFPRVKIGVGKKPGKWDLADWVLAKFPDDAKDDLSSALENAAEAVKLMVNDEIDKAMNLYNS